MPSKRPPRPPIAETPATSAVADHAGASRTGTGRSKFPPRRPNFDAPVDEIAPAEPAAQSPQHIAWYEDLRFGAALMLLLLILNLALIYAIPMMAAPAADAGHEIATTPADTGNATSANPSSITVYAHPDANASTDAANVPPHGLPSAPAKIPAPTASPLDRSKSMEENLRGEDQ